MRVAIVTPYYQESVDYLRRCHDSVRAQSYRGVRHLFVADGHPNEILDQWDCDHIKLPFSHRDAGATPRAMGGLSVFARGYDALGFLDADNWIDPDHVEQMIAVIAADGAQFVAATRRIHSGLDERELYTDFIESNTEQMVDTNCMFLTRDCAPLLGWWVTDPNEALVSDRVFWSAVKSSGARISRCMKPTVAYATRWAFHFGYAGEEIPPDAVWMWVAEDGSRRLRPHKDLTALEKEEVLRNNGFKPV